LRHELGSTQPASRADWNSDVPAEAWNAGPAGSISTVK